MRLLSFGKATLMRQWGALPPRPAPSSIIPLATMVVAMFASDARSKVSLNHTHQGATAARRRILVAHVMATRSSSVGVSIRQSTIQARNIRGCRRDGCSNPGCVVGWRHQLRGDHVARSLPFDRSKIACFGEGSAEANGAHDRRKSFGATPAN